MEEIQEYDEEEEDDEKEDGDEDDEADEEGNEAVDDEPKKSWTMEQWIAFGKRKEEEDFNRTEDDEKREWEEFLSKWTDEEFKEWVDSYIKDNEITDEKVIEEFKQADKQIQ